jgi:hypothetical protein
MVGREEPDLSVHSLFGLVSYKANYIAWDRKHGGNRCSNEDCEQQSNETTPHNIPLFQPRKASKVIVRILIIVFTSSNKLFYLI